jgi:thiol:disulfide interchange protein DsbD
MRLAWVLIATVALGAARVPAAPDPVTSTMKVAGGKAVVEMTIASGWHVQSHDPGDKFLIATTLEVTPPAGQRAGAVEYPTAVEKALGFAEGKKLRLYEGRVTLAAPLEGTATDAGPVRAKLRYQACDDTTCLPPKTVELTAEQPAKTPPARAARPRRAASRSRSGSSAGAGPAPLAWVVLLGMALNLTPCVYPLISVTVAFFGGTTGHERGAGLARSSTSPASASRSPSLGAIAALTGSLFGAALQQPVGARRDRGAHGRAGAQQLRALPAPAADGLVQRASRTGEGAIGAFVMGLTMGVVAAPCIGPIVVALLLYVGARQSIAEGLALFFALGLGLGLPYLALALLAEKMRRLPRSGAWLEWMEWLFGFLLLGLALHFVTPLLAPAVVAGAWACLLIVRGVRPRVPRLGAAAGGPMGARRRGHAGGHRGPEHARREEGGRAGHRLDRVLRGRAPPGARRRPAGADRLPGDLVSPVPGDGAHDVPRSLRSSRPRARSRRSRRT